MRTLGCFMISTALSVAACNGTFAETAAVESSHESIRREPIRLRPADFASAIARSRDMNRLVPREQLRELANLARNENNTRNGKDALRVAVARALDAAAVSYAEGSSRDRNQIDRLIPAARARLGAGLIDAIDPRITAQWIAEALLCTKSGREATSECSNAAADAIDDSMLVREEFARRGVQSLKDYIAQAQLPAFAGAHRVAWTAIAEREARRSLDLDKGTFNAKTVSEHLAEVDLPTAELMASQASQASAYVGAAPCGGSSGQSASMFGQCGIPGTEPPQADPTSPVDPSPELTLIPGGEGTFPAAPSLDEIGPVPAWQLPGACYGLNPTVMFGSASDSDSDSTTTTKFVAASVAGGSVKYLLSIGLGPISATPLAQYALDGVALAVGLGYGAYFDWVLEDEGPSFEVVESSKETDPDASGSPDGDPESPGEPSNPGESGGDGEYGTDGGGEDGTDGAGYELDSGLTPAQFCGSKILGGLFGCMFPKNNNSAMEGQFTCGDVDAITPVAMPEGPGTSTTFCGCQSATSPGTVCVAMPLLDAEANSDPEGPAIEMVCSSEPGQASLLGMCMAGPQGISFEAWVGLCGAVDFLGATASGDPF